jgi:hypothetical protein
MQFLSNKYTRCYYNIINFAKSRASGTLSYVERHHIIPKSLGGTNESENIVTLSAREHLICHMLLIKMTSGNDKSKMAFAAWRMVFGGHTHKRAKVTSRTYATLKTEMADARRNSKGSYTHSDESKAKIGSGNKGKRLGQKLSKEWCANISKSKKGKVHGPMPECVKEKISRKLTGKKRSERTEEHKTNISQSKLGKLAYNDGVISKMFFPGDEPDGWVHGRLSTKLAGNLLSQKTC